MIYCARCPRLGIVPWSNSIHRANGSSFRADSYFFACRRPLSSVSRHLVTSPSSVARQSSTWKSLSQKTLNLGCLSPRSLNARCLSQNSLNAKSFSRQTLDLKSIDRKWQIRWQERSQASPTSDARAAQAPAPGPAQRDSTPAQQYPTSTQGNSLATESTPSTAYVLAMFPYPSGTLHMGHIRVYTISDVVARYRRMCGDNVLFPMGWDAFGLPAENAAIERGLDPLVWTLDNIARMRQQLQSMNLDIDWSREFATCDPAFYGQTQRLFLMLLEHGLVYRAEAEVNWDPIDQTVLANEQVDATGRSWRSGAQVQRRKLKQWFIRISAFREALLDGLDALQAAGKWPDRVLSMQRHWLGRSQGARIRFPVYQHSLNGKKDNLQTPVSLDPPGQAQMTSTTHVTVFTTRPDTLFGVQYLALSAEHPLVKDAAKHDQALRAFLDRMPELGPESKAGYRLQGVSAQNPLARLTGTSSHVAEPLPVFVAPYVLSEYGDGAVMGVPGHDTRDHAFWTQEVDINSIRYVVEKSLSSHEKASLAQGEAPLLRTEHGQIQTHTASQRAMTTPGVLASCCGQYAGMRSQEAGDKIVADLEQHEKLAERATTWRLRDWLISRQRYWGTPIPIVHCPQCGTVPVPDAQLPLKLPPLPPTAVHGRKGNPLQACHDWVNVPCPRCQAPAQRDTDTMDTFVDSSWYMFRFLDPQNDRQPVDPSFARTQMPVDIYVGGVEHAILHLLYARFMAKYFAQAGLWPPRIQKNQPPDPLSMEPFTRLLSQGMVHGKTYSDPESGRFLRPDEVDLSQPSRPLVQVSGGPAHVSFEKMSKSKHNGVDPAALIAQYGADVVRAHMLFQAPVTEVLEWDETRIVGIQRWFHRLARLASAVGTMQIPHDQDTGLSENRLDLEMLPKPMLVAYETLRHAVKAINEALSSSFSFNTCISTLMSLTNSLHEVLDNEHPDGPNAANLQKFAHKALNVHIRLLAPFAPAFAEECWEMLHERIPAPPDLQRVSITPDPASSVFDFAFPRQEELPTFRPEVAVSGQRQPCVVLQNGHKRFVVDVQLPDPSLDNQAQILWLLGQLRNDNAVRNWLKSPSPPTVSSEMLANAEKVPNDESAGWWKRIIVVQGGKRLNFVGERPKAS